MKEEKKLKRGPKIEHLYKKYAQQPKNVIDACMTCPYNDCIYETYNCPHYRRVTRSAEFTKKLIKGGR